MHVKQPKFPVEIKRGSVTIRIRRVCPSPKYPDYYCFGLDYHEDGRRQRPTFGTLKEARKEAAATAERLSRGDGKAITLTGGERVHYLQAMGALNPHQVPLSTAATDYAQALGLLNGRGSIIEACRFYAEAHGDDIKPIRVQALVDDLIEIRKQTHASKRHLDDLRSRLDRFAKSFQCDVHTIRAAQMQDFLSGLKLSPRSIKNFKIAISNLFSHARLRGHAPKTFDPITGVPTPKVVDGEVEIYTPDELKSMFEVARPEMRAYLAIAAFAGLRQAELARLDWSLVKDDHIVIRGNMSKPGEKRLPTIPANLAAWLATLRREKGPVVPFKNVANELCALVAKAGVARKTNGLRHAFGSYLLAKTKHAEAVADEMGNTRAMIFKHYRKAVVETQGIRWFSIYPDANLKPIFRLPEPVVTVATAQAA